MPQVWLRSNRRVLLLALVPAAAIAALGALAAWNRHNWIVQGIGGSIGIVGLGLCVGLLGQLRRPRIACDGINVLFYVRAGAPVAIPILAVEAFFLGQGPASLPVGVGKREKAVNVVARLSQKFPEFADGKVKEALAQWSEHYLTLRGAWCEPLDDDGIRTLNRQLHETQQRLRSSSRSVEEGRSNA